MIVLHRDTAHEKVYRRLDGDTLLGDIDPTVFFAQLVHLGQPLHDFLFPEEGDIQINLLSGCLDTARHDITGHKVAALAVFVFHKIDAAAVFFYIQPAALSPDRLGDQHHLLRGLDGGGVILDKLEVLELYTLYQELAGDIAVALGRAGGLAEQRVLSAGRDNDAVRCDRLGLSCRFVI